MNNEVRSREPCGTNEGILNGNITSIGRWKMKTDGLEIESLNKLADYDQAMTQVIFLQDRLDA